MDHIDRRGRRVTGILILRPGVSGQQFERLRDQHRIAGAVVHHRRPSTPCSVVPLRRLTIPEGVV